MPPVQTVYSTEHAKAFEGMLASTSELLNTRSGTAEDTNIQEGRGVFQGTSDDQIKLPTGGEVLNAFKGITLYEVDRVLNEAQTEPVNQDRPVTYATVADIWVITEDGSTVSGATSDVYLIINAAGGGLPGRWRSTADAANTLLIPGAKFISSAGAGELAKISLNRV